jgi:hypothetical protein
MDHVSVAAHDAELRGVDPEIADKASAGSRKRPRYLDRREEVWLLGKAVRPLGAGYGLARFDVLRPI